MNKKILLIILGIVLFINGAFAQNSLDNLSGINIPLDIYAGSEFIANFGYNYLDTGLNEDGSELIIKLDFYSENSSYPVWKGDFVVSGYIDRSYLFGLFSRKIDFNCSENYLQTISFPKGKEDVEAPNGTFYCYDENGILKLDRKDEVNLKITPNMAIFPGAYNLSASFYYLSDTYPPIVKILNKDYFDNYFGHGSSIEFYVSIIDVNFKDKYEGTILANFNLTLIGQKTMQDSIYKFIRNVPYDNATHSLIEGDYMVEVYAEDEAGNFAKDYSIIKFDFTPPKLELIEPNPEVIYGEFLSIIVNVTDEKSGVEPSSVKYRLREMDGSNICPSDGFGAWDCYNSGWVLLENINSSLYGSEVNTLEIGLSGEYWLEIRASDVLGNLGVLE